MHFVAVKIHPLISSFAIAALVAVGSASAQNAVVDHEKMIQFLRREMAKSLATPTAPDPHREMVQFLRTALAKDRCATCCMAAKNADKKGCTVCVCEDHAQCPKPTAPTTKQGRLEALLEDYRADKLSPTQYHQQRAKIRAEP